MKPEQILLNPSASFDRACQLAKSGQSAQAAAIFAALLAHYPGDPRLLRELGCVHLNMQDFRQAEQMLGQSLAQQPDHPYTHLNRATAQLHLKQLPQALHSLERALALEPGLARAHYTAGNVYRTLNRPEAALQSYEQALALDPSMVEAYVNRAVTLQDLHRHPEALNSFEQALAIRPGDADTLYNHANSLMQLQQHQAAYDIYRQCTQIKPDWDLAHNGTAFALTFLKRHREAVQSFTTALRLNPEFAYLPGYLLRAKLQCCDWPGIAEQTAAVAAQAEQGKKACSPLAMLCLADDPQLQRITAGIWSDDKYPPNHSLPEPAAHSPHPKIRVAYFSADFRTHPVALASAGLYEHHDKTAFEITAFSLGTEQNDSMAQRLKAAFDAFVDARDLSDADLARLCRDMEIDIAVSLGGHTADSRPGIFACRAAPVQASYLGYAGTMAAPYMDYLIADRIVVPPHARPHYSEKLAYLPDSFMINDNTRSIAETGYSRADFGLPPEAMVYCCFNNCYKIGPRMFELWMGILRQTPGSVLWLTHDNDTAASALQSAAEASGTDPERLVFAKRLPDMAEHLARHKLADLYLDTLPYNAHAAACDALWAGLPVLTCPGQSFAARVAASLLHAANLPELVAATPDAYRALAVDLAENRQRLAAIKQNLAAGRSRAPLFDTARTTRALEQVYRAMYLRDRRHLPPEDIEIN